MSWYGIGQSDLGQCRDNNEDAFMVDNRFKMYVVCDGMGGINGGEIASAMVIHELPVLIKHLFSQCSDITDVKFHTLVQEAVNAVNAAVYAEGIKRGFAGMGSTFVLGIIKKNHLLIAHVGDSRCYLKQEEKWSVITKDHVNSDCINELTRVMGTNGPIEADIQVIPLKSKDQILLCSDGLNHMLSDREITEALEASKPKTVCTDLIAKANEAGGEDNITTVFIHSR